MSVKAGSWEFPDAKIDREVFKVDPELTEIYALTEAQVLAFRPKSLGGHEPVNIIYKSLFEVEDKTDEFYGFDLSQDIINLQELFVSFGGVMSLENIKTRVSPNGDLHLIINDGPRGVNGANYPFLILKQVQTHKHPPMPKTLAKFIII
jgi:hypothetical protein